MKCPRLFPLNNKKGSITTGVFYRSISDEINRALFVDRSDVNSGRIILTHDNFDDTSALGFEFSTNYKPTKWWSINGSFDIYSQTQKGIAERLTAPIETATIDDIVTETTEVDNVAWNFRMFNNFRVRKTLSFTAFGFYRGANETLQFNIDPMYFVNIGARVSFAEGKGSFSLNFSDIFNTLHFSGDGTRPYTQEIFFKEGGAYYRPVSRPSRPEGIDPVCRE